MLTSKNAIVIGNNGTILHNNDITTGIKNDISLSEILLYPNPFSMQATLRTTQVLHNATVTIDNCLGQTVAEISNLNGQTVTLQRNALPAGLYFMRLTEGNKQIVSKKIIIAD